jgi:hypothetical protein
MAIEKGRVTDEGLGKRKKKSVSSDIRFSTQSLLLSTLLLKKTSFTGLTHFTLFFRPSGLPEAPALPLLTYVPFLSRLINFYPENGSSTFLRKFVNI